LGLAAIGGAWKVVRGGAVGRDLIAVLGTTGKAQMLFAVTFSIGLFVGA
jgi:hypothetical protein